MEWVPIAFLTFKLLALSIAMFFAIKWHYDQAEKRERRGMVRTGVAMTAFFLLTLLAVGLLAFFLSSMLSLDLGLW